MASAVVVGFGGGEVEGTLGGGSSGVTSLETAVAAGAAVASVANGAVVPLLKQKEIVLGKLVKESKEVCSKLQAWGNAIESLTKESRILSNSLESFLATFNAINTQFNSVNSTTADSSSLVANGTTPCPSSVLSRSEGSIKNRKSSPPMSSSSCTSSTMTKGIKLGRVLKGFEGTPNTTVEKIIETHLNMISEQNALAVAIQTELVRTVESIGKEIKMAHASTSNYQSLMAQLNDINISVSDINLQKAQLNAMKDRCKSAESEAQVQLSSSIKNIVLSINDLICSHGRSLYTFVTKISKARKRSGSNNSSEPAANGVVPTSPKHRPSLSLQQINSYKDWIDKKRAKFPSDRIEDHPRTISFSDLRSPSFADSAVSASNGHPKIPLSESAEEISSLTKKELKRSLSQTLISESKSKQNKATLARLSKKEKEKEKEKEKKADSTLPRSVSFSKRESGKLNTFISAALNSIGSSTPTPSPSPPKSLVQEPAITDVTFLAGGEVKSGTVDALIVKLTHPDCPPGKFATTFLLTYPTFVSSSELLDKLKTRYDSNSSLTSIQFRVISFLKAWIEEYIDDIVNIPVLNNQLNKLLDHISQDHPSAGIQLKQSINRVEQKYIEVNEEHKQILAQIEEGISARQSRINDSDFEDQFDTFDATEFAQQLTLVEWKMFKLVKRRELINLKLSKKDSQEKSFVRTLIDQFNDISIWVAYEIVRRPGIKSRVATLKKFLHIASQLNQLNNFQGLFEVFTGIDSNPVRRMKQTWLQLDDASKNIYDSLKDLLSYNSNYKEYRNRILHTSPPYLPYVGILLKDLTSVDEGIPSTFEDGSISFVKRTKLAELVEFSTASQRCGYSLNPNLKIQQWILSICVKYDLNEIFALSLKTEPKDPYEALETLIENDTSKTKHIKTIESRTFDLESKAEQRRQMLIALVDRLKEGENDWQSQLPFSIEEFNQAISDSAKEKKANSPLAKRPARADTAPVYESARPKDNRPPIPPRPPKQASCDSAISTAAFKPKGQLQRSVSTFTYQPPTTYSLLHPPAPQPKSPPSSSRSSTQLPQQQPIQPETPITASAIIKIFNSQTAVVPPPASPKSPIRAKKF